MTGPIPGGGSWSPSAMPTGPDEVEERLVRYADGGLAPDPDQVGRLRGALLAAFAARVSVQMAPTRRHRPFRGWALAAVFALLLVGAASLVAAESGPGQPFYALRVAIGSFTLPGQGPARDRGLAAQLDDRLAEAGVAARNGDGRAAEAALNAYLRTLTELTRHGISDPAVLDELHRHLDTLQALISVTPSQAAEGLRQALDAAGHASGVTAPATPTAIPHPTPPQDSHSLGPPGKP